MIDDEKAVQMSWEKITSLVRILEERFKHDDFMQKVLKGAVRVARDNENPIRGNLCASATREVVTHILHSLAPTEKVEACEGYVQEKNTSGPTRVQRAIYIVQGGLPNEFVENEVGFDLSEMRTDLSEAVSALNKYTHVKEGTVLHEENDVIEFLNISLQGIITLLEETDSFREEISRAIEDGLNKKLMDEFLDRTIDDLDELSTHTMIDEHQAEEITVIDIDHEHVTLEVRGTVYVTLEYGSGADFRNGDGVALNDQYPYHATVRTSVKAPLIPLDEHIPIQVDNSSFYE